MRTLLTRIPDTSRCQLGPASLIVRVALSPQFFAFAPSSCPSSPFPAVIWLDFNLELSWFLLSLFLFLALSLRLFVHRNHFPVCDPPCITTDYPHPISAYRPWGCLVLVNLSLRLGHFLFLVPTVARVSLCLALTRRALPTIIDCIRFQIAAALPPLALAPDRLRSPIADSAAIPVSASTTTASKKESQATGRPFFSFHPHFLSFRRR